MGLAGLLLPGQSRAKPGPHTEPENRAALVNQRKKAKLTDYGLLPPANSPYAHGAIAPNAQLLALKDAWLAEQPEAMAAGEAAAAVSSSPRAARPPKTPPAKVEDPVAPAAAQLAAMQAMLQTMNPMMFPAMMLNAGGRH
jgi:hypothetical protein